MFIHTARLSDADKLADNLREADVEEVIAMGSHPYEALHQGLSGLAWAVLDEDEEVLAMFGGIPLLDGSLSIWMLGTEAIYDHPVTLTKQFPKWLAIMFEMSGADRAWNYVSAANEKAIDWLEMVGAKFGEGTLSAGDGVFYHFEFDKGDFLCAPQSLEQSAQP